MWHIPETKLTAGCKKSSKAIITTDRETSSNRIGDEASVNKHNKR